MPPEIRELDAGFKVLVESEMEKYRADTFWTKEPETVEWIRSFKNGDIFWDIGANIGIYSLFAAKMLPASVIWSFEPQFINFIRLVQNVGLNSIPNIVPLNIAFGRVSRITQFYAKENEPGKSGGQIDAPVDEHGNNYKPQEVLPMISMSGDDFLKYFDAPPPNHIKIDVDGREEGIIFGLQYVLGIPLLKSILVELNPESSNSNMVESLIKSCGFSVDNEFNKMQNHSRVRREQEGIKARNVVFTR